MKFAKKNQDKVLDNHKKDWKVLVVDDELEIHKITQTVLRKFRFEGRGLELLSAFSAQEAIEILKQHTDVALILLDVVMESDDAGLVAVKRIRHELNNHKVRIILRTGQPGSAPEREVIDNYDINDYREKTELSSNKLYTAVMSALRSYRDLVTIDRNRVGLEKIITASKSIFKISSLLLFVEGVLTQLVSILNLNEDFNELQISDAFFATLEKGEFKLLASTGKFVREDKFKIVTPRAVEYLDKAYMDKKSYFDGDVYVGYFEATNGNCIFLYLEGCKRLNEDDKKFIKIFSQNISIAYENIHLNQELIDTQKEIVERLGEVVENRSYDVAMHVNRVARVSHILALAYGMDETEAEVFKMASPMHDIGKIGISDEILLKPGRLTDKEFYEIQKHSEIGYNILKGSKREILQTAATIAYEHHEKWNGQGYPRGLKGNEISLYGRVSAIADVFDALLNKRTYKEAWPFEDVCDFIYSQKGVAFEPRLVNIFFENLEQIKQVAYDTKEHSFDSA